ncbi:acetolactate synthase [Mesobacillus campisalis]|uniref:Acetolactate synthase n=1 Tax=Mesobacillus campisalis TaxID=1408103 RepID=A0A0M2SRI9_9BACI|nr:acetolactate synthase large subunit [Mesobacillus campisalis]KKK36291.1 acetolactate synthase [Mesobacillus campisalis]
MKVKAAQLLIKCLEQEGVEYIFGVPGEENLDIMDALLDSEIEFIVTRHEANAAFMAGTYGRLTGKPGVCLATLGPGATNLLTGVANANMDHSPIVAITGQAGLDRQHKISHQYYDLVSVYEPVTKWNTQVKKAEIIPEVVRKAFEVAKGEKPGAAHIDLPEDIAAQDVDATPIEVRKPTKFEAGERVIKEAATMIEKAKHPLILAGMGVERGHAEGSLRKLVEKVDIPVVHTFMGKGAISWRNDLSLLTAGLSGKDYISCGFEEADLIIAVGFDMAEYPPKNWNPGGQTPVLHVDTREAETDAHYPVEHSVIGDLAENLKQLESAMSAAKRNNDWVSHVREQALQESDAFSGDESFPVKPQKIISDLRSVMREEDIVISDVGAHKMWMARMYHAYEPNTCLISNGLASMGIAVPGAIAAKMVHPEKNVVAVCGDGAFQMSSADLETAVRLKLPIVILLWRDEGYGLIEWKQLNEFKRASNVKFGNPDFIQLAKSYGFEAIGIREGGQLKDALQEAIDLNKPVLIDCPVDYSENTKLTERLGKLLC